MYNIGISMVRAGAHTYYLHDGLGSTRQLTNAAGAVTVAYMDDAFGNLVASTGGSSNPYGFTGEPQFGEADSLVFLRARYYQPATGRFLSRDPIGYEDSMDLYQYCLSNPVNWTDPSGLRVPDGIGGGPDYAGGWQPVPGEPGWFFRKDNNHGPEHKHFKKRGRPIARKVYPNGTQKPHGPGINNNVPQRIIDAVLGRVVMICLLPLDLMFPEEPGLEYKEVIVY